MGNLLEKKACFVPKIRTKRNETKELVKFYNHLYVLTMIKSSNETGLGPLKVNLKRFRRYLW